MRGRRYRIGGREFVALRDYARWRGRAVRGSVIDRVRRGIDARLWHAWVDAHGGPGVAEVAGIPIGYLEPAFDVTDLLVGDGTRTARRLAARAAALAALRGIADGRDLTGESLRDRARRWREQAAASQRAEWIVGLAKTGALAYVGETEDALAVLMRQVPEELESASEPVGLATANDTGADDRSLAESGR